MMEVAADDDIDLVSLPNQDFFRPIVRGQRSLPTHDQNALSFIVPIVVKVELAAFWRALVQGKLTELLLRELIFTLN